MKRTTNLGLCLIEAADKFSVDPVNENAEQLDRTIAAWGHANLLDNWYFADPVDQRKGYVVPIGTIAYTDPDFSGNGIAITGYRTVLEVTSAYCRWENAGTNWYAPASAAVRGYLCPVSDVTTLTFTVDRIKINQSAGTQTVLLVEDDGISVTITPPADGANAQVNIYQTVERDALPAQDCVLSWMYCADCGVRPYAYDASGLYEGWSDFPASDTPLLAYCPLPYVEGRSGTCYLNLQINTKAEVHIKLFAVKLEQGSAQTLAHQDIDGNWVLNDPPPDKAMELLKCCMSTADANDTCANNRKTFDALGCAKFAAGFYAGTGTYGADGPCVLTFDFKPRVLLLTRAAGMIMPDGYYFADGIASTELRGMAMFTSDAVKWSGGAYTYTTSGGYSYGGNLPLTFKWGDTSVSWYGSVGTNNTSTNAANAQFNGSGMGYYYVAIG